MIALVAATARGRAHAEHLARALPGARLVPGTPRSALDRAFGEADAIVCCLAVGAAVRLIAPRLADKRSDPGVVCVDDAGRFAVALAGGHEGGANALAHRVAEALGAQPVVTTASDALGLTGLHDLAAELGLAIEPGGDPAAVGAALVAGEPVRLVCEPRRPLPPLPHNVRAGAEGPAIVVSDRAGPPDGPAVALRPPSLVVGVGCSSGAQAQEILDLVDRALAAGGLAPLSVSALASIDVKAAEPGLREAAGRRGWPLRFAPAQRLAPVPVPTPSEVVRAAVGTPSVAEAAALLEAGWGGDGPQPELVVAKRVGERVTVAVARRPVRGRLALVSLGPGDPALIPPLARRALARAELVVGYGPYLERVRGLLRPGTRVEPHGLGEEVARCRRAVAEAAAGGSVALCSGGDVGNYAMASPALEADGLAGVDVVVVPGITAAQAAAALVGSPLGHDHCSISLSDLLTPWEAIERRLRAAGQGDFAIALYNPRSARRDWQLAAAREILLEHRPPGTPVALVHDAHRPGQRVTVTTLGELDPQTATMTTVVLVGSSATRLVEGRMVTPRGYAPAAVRG